MDAVKDSANFFYNLLSTNSSICGMSSVLRRFFVFETVVEALRRKRSAGWICSALAILSIISNDGIVFPHSMHPMVPVAQSQLSASFSCEKPFSFL